MLGSVANGGGLMKLQDKRAIVTGGARGIGRAIAERFVAEGAKVLIADVIDGAATAMELGPKARFTHCDVGEASSVKAMVDTALTAFGGIDVLVNNAGINSAADFLDITEADFDRVIRVNLKGAFLCTQAVARVMVAAVEKGGAPGAIVNLSSVNAVLAIESIAPYTISKGGVRQLTNVAALSLARWGIRVNAIGPGSINTDMLNSVARDPEGRRRLLSRTPLGRFGEPSEIAAIAAFLASEDASYITGQTLYADGGRMGLNYTVPVRQD